MRSFLGSQVRAFLGRQIKPTGLGASQLRALMGSQVRSFWVWVAGEVTFGSSFKPTDFGEVS